MHAGVPVIAARSPGVSETCGDAALYVDPYDADALAAALARVVGDPDLHAGLGGARDGARRPVLLARLGACPHRGIYAGSRCPRPLIPARSVPDERRVR